MRIAVTGGTGFVGRFIVEEALRAGDEVVVLSRHVPAQGFFTRTVQHVAWELGQALPVRADALVHAAFDHVPGRYRGGEGDDPEGFLRRNLQGTLMLFRDVGRVVFLSSRAVYGDYSAGTVLREEMDLRPDTLYGEAKARAEEALERLARNLDVAASLRATGVYGPGGPGRGHKWTPLFQDYREARPIAPRAGTEVHGADLARAVRILLREGVTGPVNLSDICVDRHDLLAEVGRILGVDTAPPPRSDSPVSAMAVDRIEALGWRGRGWDGLRGALPGLV